MGIAIGPEDPDLPGPGSPRRIVRNNDESMRALRPIHPPLIARDESNGTSTVR